MVQSGASTVEAYLEELPEERRRALEPVLDAVRRRLPAGYVESMNWGMIAWEIPLERYPKTYNGQPLLHAALAAQKNHYALYLMNVYFDPTVEKRLRDGFRAAGKKLDLGKSCLRFRKLEDLPLDVVGDTIAATSVEETIARYEASRRGRG